MAQFTLIAHAEYITTVVRGIARADLKMAYDNNIRYLRGTEQGDLILKLVCGAWPKEKATYRLSFLNDERTTRFTGTYQEMLDYLTHEVYTIELDDA